MTLKEALELLDAAPQGEEPSRLNPNLPQRVAVDIVRSAVATLGQPREKVLGMDDTIDPLAEKRVLQVSQNKKRPKWRIDDDACPDCGGHGRWECNCGWKGVHEHE